jgi:hypothetical protein
VSVDPATLKPGDQIRNGPVRATVLAVDGDDIFARSSPGYAFITDGESWELVPTPPLIYPEQVWCISPERSVYRSGAQGMCRGPRITSDRGGRMMHTAGVDCRRWIV